MNSRVSDRNASSIGNVTGETERTKLALHTGIGITRFYYRDVGRFFCFVGEIAFALTCVLPAGSRSSRFQPRERDTGRLLVRAIRLRVDEKTFLHVDEVISPTPVALYRNEITRCR